ncbi:MAG: hypothetical protein PHP23_15605 [Desulfobacterales bacterium]|nr:hypothetical protein [Desulfobacterales bacterium]MDD4072490.1 hypothetical protein [Desulfobacterales bacterium]MDD4391126.1 hypothetical protein [Desulfobacterales bacterium]
MKFKQLTLIGLTAILTFLFGCAEHYQEKTLLEKNWGKSFETARYQQILNPEAGKSMAQVTGLDGQAALNNLTKYRTDFEKATEAPSYNLNLTGSGGK